MGKSTLSKAFSKIGEFLNWVLYKLGYRLTRISSKDGKAYSLHSYLDDEGNFDYERYRRVQEEGNKRKIEFIWAQEENIALIANYLKSHLDKIEFGICHGTRNGVEQSWFKNYLNCDVIGTEISETADQFPDTIRWDFHDTKPEWINSADFIYSNSFDHSYDPQKCLNAWISCLKPGHFCIIEHSSLHEPEESGELDPFGAEITIMPYLITKWGKGEYFVREILDAPNAPQDASYSSIIIIQKAKG